MPGPNHARTMLPARTELDLADRTEKGGPCGQPPFTEPISCHPAQPWASASGHPMKVRSIFHTLLPKHDASTDPARSDASGPSSQQQQPQAHPRTASSKSKRPRKDPDATPEKRGAIFKKACPKNILDRVARVMSQR